MRVVNLLGYPAILLAFLSHRLAHDASWEPAVTFTLAAIGVRMLARTVSDLVMLRIPHVRFNTRARRGPPRHAPVHVES